ncbi:DedA family protein [Sphingomonas japonica]|uniref:Membrane protein DedA with SNARE-associated domain n=1 Tax=Sphingomonas japonica TaxID=511662 RepID=A0ABX0U2R8_9SPHN|nr:DedA family protein [Sphingomonas japonica]NIJ23666.1 membrane protein DedA with SNARE-associated domain [Sphingomonas japonica]
MTEFILDWIEAWGYLGIFVLMFLENVFPPIPSEVILGLGGIAVAQGRFELVPLIVAGTAGTVAGNCVWFVIGRVTGYQRFKPIIDRFGRILTLDWNEVEKMYSFFLKHGGAIVFWVRFLPTFRTMISLPAGMVKMPWWKFLVFTTGGSLIWNTMLALAGLWLGNRFEELDRYFGPLALVAMGSIVILYVYRVFTWKPGTREGE